MQNSTVSLHEKRGEILDCYVRTIVIVHVIGAKLVLTWEQNM